MSVDEVAAAMGTDPGRVLADLADLRVATVTDWAGRQAVPVRHARRLVDGSARREVQARRRAEQAREQAREAAAAWAPVWDEVWAAADRAEQELVRTDPSGAHSDVMRDKHRPGYDQLVVTRSDQCQRARIEAARDVLARHGVTLTKGEAVRVATALPRAVEEREARRELLA